MLTKIVDNFESLYSLTVGQGWIDEEVFDKLGFLYDIDAMEKKY